MAMDSFRMLRLFGMIVIFAAYKWNQPSRRPLETPHEYEILSNFLSDTQHKTLMKVFEDVGDFPAAKQDWTSEKWISIGEDYEPTEDGKCIKAYTMLNKETGKCQFPNRIDIGMHFIKTGGFNGWKESYSKMMRRLNPFIHYEFDAYKRTEFKQLFEMDDFQQSVKQICGASYPYFRPFQLSLILNLPGQSVPMHLDIPYFWPATRYAFPQWLLLVMQDSGLFKQQRLPQVQALVYVHDWKVSDEANSALYDGFGGQFVVYPHGPEYPPKIIPAAPKSAIFCDGSELVHGTSTFKPNIEPYPFDKDTSNKMRFDKDKNVWRLYVDDKATDIVYSWQEIRASIAYRGWCFSDKDVMDEWDPTEWSGDWTLDYVLNKLRDDLVETKNVITLDKWNGMDAYDKGLLLMNTYIRLPRPELSRIPFNYCLIFTQLPEWGIIKTFENLLC